MLSAVPNFFVDPSDHCDSSEIKEHIIPEVILSMITSVTPSSQQQLGSPDDSQFRNLISFPYVERISGHNECPERRTANQKYHLI